ncbi:MAG: signal recognition particle-docking protein FtsY [Caldisericota bacterium]|nr:signal recognition particle-docking protein FtsY [Caldisericota bacterium]
MKLLKTIKKIFEKNDSNSIENIEGFMLENNFGVEFTENFIEKIKEEKVTGKNIEETLKEDIKIILNNTNSKIQFSNSNPTVFLFVGTNGTGKTTSIAKLAHLYKNQGKKIMLVAGDTFRAAASKQLEIWANKLNIPAVMQKEGSDPGAVVFDGLNSAISKNIDILLIDSAGRVETKKNLLQELQKIERVIEKKIGRKPDETLLVLDAYTGQNGIAQIETFSSMVNISGIILTKIDGSSSGGIIIPIIQKYGIPVKFICTGENMEDIEQFNAEAFIEMLSG